MRQPANSDSQPIELSLPNLLGHERIAMACAAAFARGLGFANERIEDLKTIVAEACTNAVRHGNRGIENARVRVSMRFRAGEIQVAVIDAGRGMAALPEDPDVEKIVNGLEPPGGFGLFLIRQLADRVDFNDMTPAGHGVQMILKREPPSPADAGAAAPETR